MASFALALFLAGSNYCLVGGIAAHFGARVSCMAPAGAASGSCHAAPASSHCARAASAAGSSRNHARPARTATPPCCVALAPVVASTGVKIFASAPALALPVVPAADVVAAPLHASWRGHRIFRDSGPPPLHPRAPLSPRAPPLA
jgi:hypothetical protein